MNSNKPSRDRDKPRSSGEQPKGGPAAQQAGQPPPAYERRGRHRVADDQQSGNGSLTALSKLMMIERKRAALLPADNTD